MTQRTMRQTLTTHTVNNVFAEVDPSGTSGYVDGQQIQRFVNVDTYGDVDINQMSDLTKPSNCWESNGFALPTALCAGIGRFIGCGIEVHNVTAELYKSGTVTIGEIPQASASQFAMNHITFNQWDVFPTGGGPSTTNVKAPFYVAQSVRPLNNRPANIDEAMTYPGSRQWEAKDGVYMVLTQEGINNRPTSTEYVQPAYWNNTYDEQVGSVSNQRSMLLVPTQDANSDLSFDWKCSANPLKWAPLACKFAIFSGLTHETKLTVNFRCFYESFPSFLEEDILTLATPSPDYDAHALALYQHCQTHMPIAVPVGENAMGDWFAKAVSEFADVAGLGLSAMGVPFAEHIAGRAKSMADNYIKTKSNKQTARGKIGSTAQAMNKQRQKQKKKARTKTAGGVTAPLINGGKGK